MEICFSHIANYLRVVTSLTVLGDNEWLIGHSSHRHCALPLSPTPFFHSNYLFDRLCWLLSIQACASPSLLRCMCTFLEVTGNVISGCKAGSAVKGTWLVFVSTMIPQASKCWRMVLLRNADSGLVVLTVNDWHCLVMSQDWIHETRENSSRICIACIKAVLEWVSTCRHNYYLSYLSYHDKYAGNSQLWPGSCFSGYLVPQTSPHGLDFPR